MMAIQLTDSGVEPVVITGSQLFMAGQFHCVHPFRDLQFTRPDKILYNKSQSYSECLSNQLSAMDPVSIIEHHWTF